jgi:TP901 family phage tail tape measure protein
MADRTVSVNLVVDAKRYVQGMDEAGRKTQDLTRTVEQQLAAQERAYTQVGAAATGVGVLALAGVAAAVSAYSQFDSAMDGVQAATHESASSMELLSDAALDAGQRTVYSATEAAAAIENLSRAGVSTADILNGALDGALDLAASDGLAVADAAELAASAMTQFGLAGEDVSHVADLLAAGAGKAQGGVADLGAALNQSGLVAAQMGLSIDDTVGSLTAFASAGLIGSDAGTSFRSMLLRLGNPTQESAREMERLGLSFYDAQGQFIGMEGVAGQLESRLGSLTDQQRIAALGTIFGQDAIRAASIAYEEGADGIAGWTEAVDEQGYAAETAAIRLDNLKGDLEELGGAWETFMIGLGAGADGPMRFSVQVLTNLVEGLGDLDPVTQTALLAALGLTGGIATLGGTAMVALPQVVAFRGALTELGISGDRTSRVMAGLKGALGIGAAFGGALVGATLLHDFLADEFLASTEEVQNSLTQTASAAEILRAAMGTRYMNPSLESARVELDNVSTALDDAIGQARNWWDAISPQNSETLGNVQALGDAIGTLADTDLSQAQAQFAEFSRHTDGSREQLYALLSQMDDYRTHLIDVASQQGINVTTGSEWENQEALVALALGETEIAAEGAAEGADEVAVAYTTTAEAATELLEAQQKVIDQWFAAQDAMIGYEQAVDDLQEAINDGLAPALDATGANFDLSNEAGREAASMLGDIVQQSNATTESLIAQNASTEEMEAHQAAARAEIARLAGQMDATGAVAETYTGQLLDIPDAVVTPVTFEAANALSLVEFYMQTLGRVPAGVNTFMSVSKAQAQADVESFINTNDGRRIRIDVVTGQVGVGASGALGVNLVRAQGGRIPGWSPGVDDRLGYAPGTGLIGLGGGEFIVRTLMADRYLPILEQINAGTFPGYASGGRVGTPTYSPSTSVHVAAPAVAFPSTMQARLDLGGGQFIDAVMHIASEAAQAVSAEHSRATALGIRTGVR